MKFYRALLVFLVSFLLYGCPISSNSYFVRWWNGDVISKPSGIKRKIWDECYKELENQPENTQEEREKASKELTYCLRKKEKEYGVR